MSYANQSVVERAYESFQLGDIDSVLEALTEDVTWTVIGPADASPLFGERRGHAGAAEYMRMFAEQLELQAFKIDRFVAQGDTVVALGHSDGTVRSSGKPLAVDWAHVFTLRGGKICAYQEFVDSALIARTMLAA